MSAIQIAIVGVGNCASSLIQGIHYYRDKSAEDAIGLMHWKVGGYGPSDIRVVAAFDIDERKVGRDVHEAIFAEPNCTTVFQADLPPAGVTVSMGAVLDGYSEHMADHPQARSFVKASQREADMDAVVKTLKDSGTEVMLNYLPVGS